MTGISRYISDLLFTYSRLDLNNKYCLISKEDIEVTNLNFNGRRNMNHVQKKSRSETLWGQYWLPRTAVEQKLDLVHCPSVRAPVFHKVPVVLTVHDVIFRILPGYYTAFDRNYMNFLYEIVLNRVDKIIAVSECTKKDLMQYYRIADEKITVVYNGISNKFRKIQAGEATKFLERKGLLLPEEFILFVGTIEPRKNLPALIEAFLRLKAEGLKHKLVIVGKEGWLSGKLLASLSRPEMVSQIIHLDGLGDEYLPYVYSLADVMVYPSVYEGFGYPVVEAMSCGTPVVTSLAPAITEIAGQAAYFTDARSSESLYEAVGKLVSDKVLKKSLIEKGYERIRLFDLNTFASRTLEVYESAI